GLHHINGSFVSGELEQGGRIAPSHSRDGRIFACHEYTLSCLKLARQTPRGCDAKSLELPSEILAGLRFPRAWLSPAGAKNRGFANIVNVAVQHGAQRLPRSAIAYRRARNRRARRHWCVRDRLARSRARPPSPHSSRWFRLERPSLLNGVARAAHVSADS